MKRIAILGCENSHANAFLKFIVLSPLQRVYARL